MTYWRSKTYPTSKKRRGTIFFLCPFSTKLTSFTLSINQLRRKGYDVIAYDYSRDVLEKGDPNIVPEFVADIRKEIEKQIKNIGKDQEFGLFGSSMGAFISYCILDIPEIDWVIMNTGGNLARGAWALPLTKAAFQAEGVTVEQLQDKWNSLQSPQWNNVQGKPVVLLASTGDAVATIQDAKTAHQYMLSHGVNCRLIVQRKLSHRYTLIYNLSRAGRLLSLLPKPPNAEGFTLPKSK